MQDCDIKEVAFQAPVNQDDRITSKIQLLHIGYGQLLMNTLPEL